VRSRLPPDELPLENLPQRGAAADLEFVLDVIDGTAHIDHPPEIDRGRGQHQIAIHRVDRLLQLGDLPTPIPHRRQQVADVWVLVERIGDRTDRVRPWIHQLCRSETPGSDDPRAVGHPAVDECGPVLYHQHPPSPVRLGVRDEDGRGPLCDRRIGIDGVDVPTHLSHYIGTGCIDLVDHYSVGEPQIRLAGVIPPLVVRPVGGRPLRCADQPRIEVMRVMPSGPHDDHPLSTHADTFLR